MWFDVFAADDEVEAVSDFYRAVFEGPLAPNPGDDSPYKTWMMNGDQPWAAVVRVDEQHAGRWVPYVHVDDLDAAVDAATAAGGTIVIPKTDGPAGPAVTVADPAGALVALWVPFPDQG